MPVKKKQEEVPSDWEEAAEAESDDASSDDSDGGAVTNFFLREKRQKVAKQAEALKPRRLARVQKYKIASEEVIKACDHALSEEQNDHRILPYCYSVRLLLSGLRFVKKKVEDLQLIFAQFEHQLDNSDTFDLVVYRATRLKFSHFATDVEWIEGQFKKYQEQVQEGGETNIAYGDRVERVTIGLMKANIRLLCQLVNESEALAGLSKAMRTGPDPGILTHLRLKLDIYDAEGWFMHGRDFTGHGKQAVYSGDTKQTYCILECLSLLGTLGSIQKPKNWEDTNQAWNNIVKIWENITNAQYKVFLEVTRSENVVRLPAEFDTLLKDFCLALPATLPSLAKTIDEINVGRLIDFRWPESNNVPTHWKQLAFGKQLKKSGVIPVARRLVDYRPLVLSR